MPSPIIKTISFLCDGRPRRIDAGFIPDIILTKLGEGTTPWGWWTPTSWCQRNQRFGTEESVFLGIQGVDKQGGILLSPDASINVAGQILYLLCLADNGSGLINNIGWMGNATGQTVKVGPTAPAAVFAKRDNARDAVFKFTASTSTSFVSGFTAPQAAGITAINTDGTLTLGTLVEVNEMSGGLVGEAIDSMEFWTSAGIIEIPIWAGNNSTSRVIAHTVVNPCACLIFANSNAVRGAFKTKEMNASTSAAATSFTFTDSLTGIITTGPSTRENTSAKTYYSLVFAASDVAQVLDSLPVSKTAAAVALNGVTSSIDCGTDASLSMVGAASYEWWGAVNNNINGAENTKIGVLMARSAGDEGRADSDGLINGAGVRLDGTWSWGIFAGRPNDLAFRWAGPQFRVITTNYCNAFDDATSENDVRTKPWRTGIIIPTELFHVLVTHNGTGSWKLYLNGKLVKQRNIDMTGITLADDAGTRVNAGQGTGHRTVIGARQGSSTIGQNSRSTFVGASVYGSELTPAQVTQMYRRNFLGEALADIIPTERWLAENVTGNALTASINPANNGIITGGGKVIRDAWAHF